MLMPMTLLLELEGFLNIMDEIFQRVQSSLIIKDDILQFDNFQSFAVCSNKREIIAR